MAKKAATPKAAAPECTPNQDLLQAIVTVRHLQEFIKEHGGLDKSLAAVVRVHELIEMTGGVERLKQGLELVGRESQPAAAAPAPEAAPE